MDDHQRPLINRAVRAFAGVIAFVLPLFSASPGAAQTASELVAGGRYEQAIELVGDGTSATVEQGLALIEAYRRTGQFDNAMTAAQALHDREHDDWRPATALAELLLFAGSYDAVVELLTPFVEQSEAPSPVARFLRAEAFFRQGRQSRANLEYSDFVRLYNEDGASNAETLLLVALACERLGLVQDANNTFRAVLELNAASQEARLHWAYLLADKYRPDEAMELVDEILALNPRHPDALVLKARLLVDLHYDIEAAATWIDDVLEIAPGKVEALELRAELAIDDRRFDRAVEALQGILDRFPSRVESLTLLAAVHLLRDEETELRELERRIQRIRPSYAEFYHRLGEVSVRSFRYVEAMDWFQRAIDTDGGYWRAYVSLGIGYSRLGDDQRALRFLRRAFDNDPFNLQAFNMLELFETGLQEYDVVEDAQIEGLSYRFHRSQADILGVYVPPAIHRAWSRYVDAYGTTPEPPVSIEIFHDQATFGVRSVGLPHASQHGICFGHLVTSRSPMDGNFNWQMVLEHELSHVFSLTVSNYRVPRWLSEGMAEYDTALAESHWRREEELSLVRALQGDGLVSVDDLDRAFISVDDVEQIVAAYFQAALTVEFIAETWGYDRLVAMLRSYADARVTADVVAEVLDTDVAGFDARFDAWLRGRLGSMVSLFDPSLRRPVDVDVWRATVLAEGQGDAEAWANLGLGLLQQGEADASDAAFVRALSLDPQQRLARLVLGVLRFQQGEYAGAIDALTDLVAGDRDSYSGRLYLGLSLRASGRLSEALVQLEQAASLYPRDADSRRALAEIYEVLDRPDAAMAMWAQVAELDENDVAAPLRVSRAAREAGNGEHAVRFAQRALQVAPFVAAVHTALGHACAMTEDWSCAVDELELELRMGAEDRRATILTLIAAYLELGRPEDAERMRRLLGG